jgi:hypothetical protein
MSPQASLILSLLLVGLPGCDASMWTAVAQEHDAPPVELDPSRGSEIGFAFEAFLSPHQEPGDEEATPSLVPKQFKSTTASTDRLDRASRGHGMVRFTGDLSVAYVDVEVEGIDTSAINMFHLHCGRPDQLGPIMVDFGHDADLAEAFETGVFQTALNFTHIEATRTHGNGPVNGFLAGCPIVPGINDDHKTISGMKYVADQGDLYFNLHTTGQTYFGDIRGRLHPVPVP